MVTDMDLDNNLAPNGPIFKCCRDLPQLAQFLIFLFCTKSLILHLKMYIFDNKWELFFKNDRILGVLTSVKKRFKTAMFFTVAFSI